MCVSQHGSLVDLEIGRSEERQNRSTHPFLDWAARTAAASAAAAALLASHGAMWGVRVCAQRDVVWVDGYPSIRDA